MHILEQSLRKRGVDQSLDHVKFCLTIAIIIGASLSEPPSRDNDFAVGIK